MTDEQKTEILIEHTAKISKLEADKNELMGRVEKLEYSSENHRAEIAEVAAQNREQFNRILVLENQSQEIKLLAQSTHEMALSLNTINGKVDDLGDRVADIEDDRKEKYRVIWQVIISAVIGGGLTYAVTQLIGG